MADKTSDALAAVEPARPLPHSHDSVLATDGNAAKTERDPVCGMMVDPHTTTHRAEHDGHPYYFCSAGCRAKFAADPAK